MSRVLWCISALSFVAFLFTTQQAAAEFINVALTTNGGVASQSTTRVGSGGNDAIFAIDGNTNGNFNSGSVTHTLDQPNSFWEVQLADTNNLENVVLFNRSDCCGVRLSNFRLSVFDGATEVYGQDFFTTGSVPQGGDFHAGLPFGTVGDRVRVQLLGSNNQGNGVLSLAEAQVFGGNQINIARNPNAVATQSSDRVGTGGNVASVAIDGITDGEFFGSNSVTHTLNEANSFWQVDFGGTYDIDEVVLFNRAELPERLSNFRLSVLNDGTETYGIDVLNAIGASEAFLIPDGVLGDTVRVQLNGFNGAGNGILSLAEVQVFGSEVVPEPSSMLVWAMVGLGIVLMRKKRSGRK